MSDYRLDNIATISVNMFINVLNAAYPSVVLCLPFLSVSLLKKQHKGVTGKSGSQENVPHENKSHFDEMIMISPLYLTNMLSWMLLELAH